jgi:hypothetical protein
MPMAQLPNPDPAPHVDAGIVGWGACPARVRIASKLSCEDTDEFLTGVILFPRAGTVPRPYGSVASLEMSALPR